MAEFEVDQPIINTPYEEPEHYWYIHEGETPRLREGRRPSVVYPPSDTPMKWDLGDVLAPSDQFSPGYEMRLVNLIRERLEEWRAADYPGVTRVSREVIEWWRRDGRETPLFFAQLEAAETIIFLQEARDDYLQGVNVPTDDVGPNKAEEGLKPFLRYACKMATGAGKTTVMGMIIVWSILNKVNNRQDARFSDSVLIVCPNITIKNRLAELNPEAGEASLYRTRDLVPPHLMPLLAQGKVYVTNWHVLQRLDANSGNAAKVTKKGVPVTTTDTVYIRDKTDTAYGYRYLTLEDYRKQVATGMLKVVEEYEKGGELDKADVEITRYVESDTAWDRRVLGKEFGGKQNILVLNDEAHHAYRIRQSEQGEDEEDMFGETSEADEFFQEATIWVEGLDLINKMRGINFAVDMSATPYYLGRVGYDTNKPFPWVVSDFGLTDAIESGLTKIPQLVLEDVTGADRPAYFNLWKWIIETQLEPSERGSTRGNPKPEAILKYAHTPIALLGKDWEKVREAWETESDEERPPVFIIVCKNTKIADCIYEWIAHDECPEGIPPSGLESLRNTGGKLNTFLIHSKIDHDKDAPGSNQDKEDWTRLILDTVGMQDWPRDEQGRPVYPSGFEELAGKVEKPLHPPGRDVRCVVSVSMLTEGWDCNTVTHIIGLRPFMSQLLCEQVAGRGLRRTSYEVDEHGMMSEEVAQILGVPFEVVPYKAPPDVPQAPQTRRHVHALPDKREYRIEYPRVTGYTQTIQNRIKVRDWEALPDLTLDPMKIPPEVQMKASLPTNEGRPSLSGPGALESIDLSPFRQGRRLQQLAFQMAADLTRDIQGRPGCELSVHVIFPQALAIVQKYLDEKVEVLADMEIVDVFLAPYYGWALERLRDSIVGESEEEEPEEVPRYDQHRGPGSTDDIDFWTTRDVRVVEKSHLNFAVADTKKWEQSATYRIDKHDAVEAFVKNTRMGLTIPYFHNNQPHDYVPDFIIRLTEQTADGQERYLIIETKGHDDLADVKKAAAVRWCDAVNADGQFGQWEYSLAYTPDIVPRLIDDAVGEVNGGTGNILEYGRDCI